MSSFSSVPTHVLSRPFPLLISLSNRPSLSLFPLIRNVHSLLFRPLAFRSSEPVTRPIPIRPPWHSIHLLQPIRFSLSPTPASPFLHRLSSLAPLAIHLCLLSFHPLSVIQPHSSLLSFRPSSSSSPNPARYPPPIQAKARGARQRHPGVPTSRSLSYSPYHHHLHMIPWDCSACLITSAMHSARFRLRLE
jgi:hypothetical protein